MQHQPEPRETVAQVGEEALGLLAIARSPRRVVGETDDDDRAARLPLPPFATALDGSCVMKSSVGVSPSPIRRSRQSFATRPPTA
jgi:hypothetical protein